MSKSGTSNGLKKSIGRLIVKLNSEILEFLPEQKKVTNEVQLSSKGVVIRDSIKVKKEALEEALSGLEARPDYIIQESLEKFVKMIKCNITTAQKLLETETDSVDGNEMEITNAKEEAYKTVDEVLKNEDLAEVEMRKLTSTLANLAQDDFDKDNSENKDEENVKRELTAIGSYQAERFQKMKKEIKEKMKFYKDELLSKWIQQKEILDYQALKEIRSEFEVTHKKLRFMVNEWERRKYSDILSDYLVDLIDIMFDDYMVEFRKMDEEKRTEAAVLRKKNIELEDYKREKKRAIPSWPKSLTYTKFKPDLLSWDKEHHLSTGSVKFGLLAEMLKTQGRITVYEQIQTRLGKSRNDSNIIPQVVTLLDAINEETVYNKLCSAWDDIANLKKTKDESLNNFFSRFETLQYSMNLADDAFVEQEPLEKGKEFTYYEEREKMLSRKVELNDKLKAVQLLKALGVDENHKRDILAKVNFNREPKQVYEDTKTAIRDICGETSRELEKDLEKPDEVNIVKPWQERKADFSGPRPHFSRSRSRDDWRRNRSQERRPRSYSRDFDRSRERSDSRGRSKKILKLPNAGKSIELVETPGGHFIIPLCDVAEKKDAAIQENLKEDKADAVMLVLLDETDDVGKLHDEIGHAAFVGLALTDDEKTQVSKVHRYFGHRSGRRTWEMFAKAEKLKGKKQEVIELIDRCKICSQMKKAPPRPKVGLPVANDFNEVVGMDLKVLNKEK
jgi:hypothetical protein